jgi:ABC-2 type transport system ATP-binding protein
MPVIEINDLHKRFGKNNALDGLNLEVESAKVYGFLGPNGAGKTTTIRTLLGMLRPTSGSAKVFGLDSWNDAKEIHKRVAYVPGETNLWGNLTGGQVIDMLLSFTGGKIADAKEYIDLFELDTSKKVRTYSKGNKQKISLVTAFAQDVDLYIFDEPTSGLDPLMEKKFQDHVLKLKENGKTVLLSSHILSEVEALADEIGIIRLGKLVEHGSLDQIKASANESLEEIFLSKYEGDK